MQALKDTRLLKHRPDTLKVVRKEFDLHKPGRIEESVDRLDAWIKAQPHFKKKDYTREYLETFIIIAKGSVESAKKHIEKLCAYKTCAPQFFDYTVRPADMKNMEKIEFFCLPKLTKEHNRIIFLRNTTNSEYTQEIILNYLVKSHMILEYCLRHNYSTGVRIILDYRNTDLTFFLRAMKYPETRTGFYLFFKGYGTRIKSVHILTNSKLIDVLVSAVGQIISIKMLGRIHVHKSLEDLYLQIDKDLLPFDYGGKEKTTSELRADWEEEMGSNEFMDYLKDMFQATVDTSLKPIEKFDEIMGMQGTFRTLSID